MAKQLKDFLKGVDNASEVLKAIENNLSEANCKLFVDDGKDNIYIPKSRLDDKIAELRTATDTIVNLQNSLKDAEGSAEKIKDLKTQIAEYSKQVKGMQLDSAIALVANEFKAKAAKDLKVFLDMSTVKLNEDGTAIGLKEQVEQLVKDKPYLFDAQSQAQPQNRGGINLGFPGKPSSSNLFDTKTMHEGDFGRQLAQASQSQGQGKEINSDYFFK